jgi:Holliday junction resolvase
VIDFSESLKAKQFFRFTGTPENWLTAIEYMTWGLKREYEDRWKRIQPGDIFFMHSTGNSIFKNAKSGIIGIGVVGPEFSVKENYLWLEEIQKQQNFWPLLVPFSEIYLFSQIPKGESWIAPEPDNINDVRPQIDRLLRNFIPLSRFPEFPKMGAFSSVRMGVAEAILSEDRPLYEYRSERKKQSTIEKPTPLREVKSASESLRYAVTLQAFEDISRRIVKHPSSTFTRDNDLLARAETTHLTILQQLLNVFRKHGYNTMFNHHVDLFAYNEEQSFLVEVKSTENRNFRSQARKGIVQLLEYDYFEIRKFISDEGLKFQREYKLLAPSQVPRDEKYVQFINSIDIGVGIPTLEGINAVGVDLGFTKV